MVNIPPFVQWAILILILLLIFSRILKFFFGKKKTAIDTRLGKDARAVEKMTGGLGGMPPNKKKEALKKIAGLGKEETKLSEEEIAQMAKAKS